MKLLKTERAWKRWAKKAYLSPNPTKPTQFPCFAMSICTSCAYEETDGFYLYRGDLETMLSELNKVTPCPAPKP